MIAIITAEAVVSAKHVAPSRLKRTRRPFSPTIVKKRNGLGGFPDDIEDAVAALLSDGCVWINEQRIEVPDGMFL